MRLTLVRGVTRLQWVVFRLISVLIVALGFLAMLVTLLALAGLVGLGPVPRFTELALWDMCLRALGLVCIGWFEVAFALLTDGLWFGLSATFLLLVLAAFGGPYAPFMPFAQWIVHMHNLPGALTMTGGAFYLGAWLAWSGMTALWAAHQNLRS